MTEENVAETIAQPQPEAQPEDIAGHPEEVAGDQVPPAETPASDERMTQLQQQVDSLSEQKASLEAELAGAKEELDEVSRRLREDWQTEVGSLKEQLAAAVASYRTRVLAAEPELPEELVKGDTVAEIDASLAAARALVARVKSQLEAQAAAGRVPTGAPPRAAPDLSALSPREKIAYALTRQ